MSNGSLVSLGSGIALGALATGVVKAIGLLALGVGLGIMTRNILTNRHIKESNACNYGQKQS